ncbi:copper resistance protein B [Nitrosomonas eutropha]|uniref:Copper resistance protein B n=1 Tax=Nitrosomonas eutropha TaxID=916 RepID=A0A1I7H2D6_9PROT|nr:copper resistance protein B [Nitrosomonas eutropha]SFU54867.1 copper resistance protein B [Nitrosomonas eutropha]
MKFFLQLTVGIVAILFSGADSSLPAARAEMLSDKEKQTLSSHLLRSQGEYHHPTHSEQNYAFLRADVLEYRPGEDGSDFRWDVQGWYGGDFNRLWFKSEGERNTAFKADYDIDMQLLYSRFVGKYYDFQVGVRGEAQTFRGGNVARAHAVIGFQGLAPYRYEVESALFISQAGDVSVRFQTSRDFLLTQRLILQGRFETHAAVQKVEKFTTGRGLNNIELGLRLRYEIRREIAPYIGISYDRSFFKTADLVREEGGDSSQVRFMVGVQLWF